MSKRQTLMLFGVIIISFLFLGFPAFWDKIIAVFCGLVIIFIALRMKPEVSRVKKYSYVEHRNDNEDSGRVRENVDMRPTNPNSTSSITSTDITSTESRMTP